MRLESWMVLLAWIPVALLYKWWVTRNTPPALPFSVPVSEGAGARNPQAFLALIRLAALALLFVALARPQASFRETERTVSGIDIMMVMDVSASMNIETIFP